MATLKSEIEKMIENETLEYPLRRRDSVKVTTCRVGRVNSRRYSVKTDWRNEKVIVRRIE